jgi:PAS domain S-box-containing protein
MMPNTAMALLLIGTAGALRQREDAGRVTTILSVLAAVVVLGIGVGTLAEYTFDIDLRIDQLLVHTDTAPYPGRPSPPTALALTLLGAAVVFFDVRVSGRARPSEWLVLLAGLLALTAFMGFVFGAAPLYRLARAPVIGVAVPTAVSLLLISIGLLLERPAAGVMGVATSPGPGGVVLRRLAAPAVLVPLLLGLVVARLAATLGIDELSLVIAVLASAMTVVALALLAVTAVPLNRTHEALESIRTRARSLVEQAPDGIFVADLNGRYTDVNDAGCRLLGYAREEIIGKAITDLIPPDDVDRLWRSREELLEGATHSAEWRLRSNDGSYVPVEVNARILADGRWQGFVRDIRERKHLEKQAEDARERLRESEERFRLAFEEAPIGMALLHLDGHFVRVNRVLCEIVGYRAEELTGLTFQAITHPEDLDVDLALAGQLHRGEIPRYQLEKRYVRKDGAIVDIMLSGSILRDPSGQPQYFIAQVEDITARKQLENALRLSEAKSTGILSISADAIVSIDEQQHITMFNEGAEKIFGYSATEAIGAPLDILIPPRLRAVHRDHVDRFVAGPEVARRAGNRDAAIIGLRKSGEEFPADAAISKLDVAGKRVLTVVLRDITEQKRLENEQRFLAELGPLLAGTLDYEETLSRIVQIAVQNLADLCILDLVEESGEVRRLKVVSREPSNAWICEVLHRTPPDKQLDFVCSVLETKGPVLIERRSLEEVEALARTYTHVGAPKAVELRSGMAIPLVARGRLLGVISLLSATPSRVYGSQDMRVGQELAERAALAVENARLYRAAQHAIQARDDVLGIVAHDLRNPLGTILMVTSVLRSRAPQLEPESVEMIQRAAGRMKHLIKDLLDVTLIDAGELTLAPSSLPAAQIVSEAVEAQKPLASAASLEYRLDLVEGLPDVWGDRNRLLQVFENLIGNALKFTAPGGCITIGAAPDDDEVRFWVSDTGSGIADEDHPYVFDRFWQARKARRQGAGLGLPIVKGIVEAHGGRVWVQSSPGRGSTFFFTIPTARQGADRDLSPRRAIHDVR